MPRAELITHRTPILLRCTSCERETEKAVFDELRISYVTILPYTPINVIDHKSLYASCEQCIQSAAR